MEINVGPRSAPIGIIPQQSEGLLANKPQPTKPQGTATTNTANLK